MKKSQGRYLLHFAAYRPYYRPDGSRSLQLTTEAYGFVYCVLVLVLWAMDRWWSPLHHHMLLATARGRAGALVWYLFGIYMTNSSLFSSTENLNTASSHTPWAQLSWVLWACVPRRVSAAYPDALRACPTMALGAEAPMPVPSLIQGSEVPHTKSALTSFSVACWANADEDVATAWLVTPAFPVLVVITAKADMVPCLDALHLLLVQLLLAGVATTQAVFLASACAIGRSINNRACVVVN